VIWCWLCSHDVGSLSRRTGPEPWSSEDMFYETENPHHDYTANTRLQ